MVGVTTDDAAGRGTIGHGTTGGSAGGNAATATSAAAVEPASAGSTPGAPAGPGRGSRRWLARTSDAVQRLLRAPSVSVIGATVALVVIIGALHPNYLKTAQLLDVLQASVYVGLLATGMAYLIAMREIDLSVGSTFALTLITVALLMEQGMNGWLAAAVGIALGAVLGGVNATIVGLIRIPTIVATLATLSVYRGLGFGLTDGNQVVGLPITDSFFTVLGGKFHGVPVSVLILAAVALIAGVMLHHTPFGYRVLAIGSNPEAAQYSGISISRVRAQVLVLTGVLAGIAGVLALAFFTSADPNIGGGYELQAIAAAVIGGIPLRGGSATVLGAVFGAILLNVVATGLAYFSVPANWSAFATGAVILLAVSIDSLVRRRRRAGPATP